MKNLADRVVVITGSSRGIGAKTASAFLEQGARVAINGRNPDRLQKAQATIDPEKKNTLAIAGDMGDYEDSKRFISTVLKAWGTIDVLVCNAGIAMRGNFADLTPLVLRSVIETNIFGTMFPALHALPILKDARGSILIVSSLAGIRGLPGISVYSASKMALTAFTDSLRTEVRDDGIHVGILYVGFTENDPDKRIFRSDGELMPLNRPNHLTQKDVARKIVYQVRKRRDAIVMSPVGKIFAFAERFAPWLVSFLLRNMNAKVAEMSK
ncbi:MAG: hypothetical protein CMN78_03615 [Spirochaetales bacterium]|nr:hypothetical protein [Spirochaetales bacterium]